VLFNLEERTMLASGLTVAAAVALPPDTIVGDDLPLAVKRVPGYLAGSIYGNVATPYDNPVISGRRVDDKTVDYWRITLNKGDTVNLTLTPESLPGGGNSPADFVIRIWGPDNQEILPANNKPVSGTAITYVAGADGTYTLGISTSTHAGYLFHPNRSQLPPVNTSPSLHVYTATFVTYPGPNTDMVDILKHYTGAWPTWTGNQLTAYNTLVKIANAGNNVVGTGIIDFSGSFEQVGRAAPGKISDWLTYTWAPFQAVLTSNDPLTTARDIYNRGAFQVLNATYPTLAEWLDVVTPFISNQKLQNAYTFVYGVLLTANQSRTNIDTFLNSLSAWSTAYQELVGDRPTTIAADLTQGLTDLPDMAKPVQQFGWLKTLIGSVVAILSSAATVAAGNPAAGLWASILLNAITNPLDAYLDGNFDNKKPEPPANPSINLAVAADQMEKTSKTTFFDTFQLLTSPVFESSLFSNYGLLRAMEHVRFSSTPNGQSIPANELLNTYDTTVWQQLLPRMFMWQSVPYTDNGPPNTLRNFTFFSPLNETANWLQPRDNSHPDHGSWTLPGGKNQMTQEAKQELMQLQAATAFTFQGHDFSPDGWFGPGPISVPQTLTGNAGSFYTITTDSHIVDGILYRFVGYPYYETWIAQLDGATIHEWSLVTRALIDGKQKVISQDAAKQLFGSGDLELAGQDPIYSPNNGTASYTYNFKVQPGGLATRYDVFTKWGMPDKNNPSVGGFSPRSFDPKALDDKTEMSVDASPSGRWSEFTNMYADFKLTYGAKVGSSKRGRS
jgi:hypothetical protein